MSGLQGEAGTPEHQDARQIGLESHVENMPQKQWLPNSKNPVIGRIANAAGHEYATEEWRVRSLESIATGFAPGWRYFRRCWALSTRRASRSAWRLTFTGLERWESASETHWCWPESGECGSAF